MSNTNRKEGSHARARRLNLDKPHIMWCPALRKWLCAAHSWDIEDKTLRDKAYIFIDRLNGERSG